MAPTATALVRLVTFTEHAPSVWPYDGGNLNELKHAIDSASWRGKPQGTESALE